MARKSRKETIPVMTAETEHTCRAAVYVRLSVEDTHTHTVSIETQQMIIAAFLESNPEISVYDTYIDNGVSGRTFHRPAFQRMLNDIEDGKVNCVIVKDLSRLGRNSIDTGYYIEQYFRIRNIRFIAVTENYDTSAPDDGSNGILIPLRNMINEAYAIDISRKIKAQQRQAMKEGKYVGGRTPFGYVKATDDCHQLILDPTAAVVVQKIFQWASEGAGLNTIVLRLNKERCITPSYYKQTQGTITHENLMGNGKWQTRTVNKILHSPVYTGDLVQGRSKIIDHKQVPAAEDEWTTVCGTHEAIISHELYDRVQQILDNTAEIHKSRTVNSYTPNLLKGKIFCSHCGGSLHRQRGKRVKTEPEYRYHCITRTRIGVEYCPESKSIREDKLLAVLADMLEQELDTTLGTYSLSLIEDSRQLAEHTEIQNKITSRRQEIERLRGLVKGLYENFVQDILTMDEYFDYKQKYESKITQLSEEVIQLESGLKTIEKQIEQYRNLKQDAKSIKEDRELTAALIDRLIDRIELSPDNQITVKYKFRSEFQNCEEVLNRCRNM